MIALMWKVLRDRWHLLVGTLIAISVGVGLIHAGLAVATTVASAQPPPGLGPAERAAYLTRLNGTNTLNGIAGMLGAFLAVFVVRSTIDFAVTERRRELALLRLAGAKRRQLRGMLMAEAFVLGVVGSLLGALIGLALAGVQRALFVHLGLMPPDVALGWQPAHLVIDLGVGVGIALAGGRAASKRAVRVTPLDALHHRGDEAALMSRSRWVLGSAAAALTMVQVALGLWAGGFLVPLLLGLGIMITGSVAASQFGPLLVPFTARLMRPFARGTLGHLAVAKARNDSRRTAQVAAPLIVLVGLVAGLQGLLDTQTKAGEVELAVASPADLIVTSTGDPAPRIRSLPGVASADTDITVPATVTLHRDRGATTLPVSVIAVDPARFPESHPYRVRSGDLAAFDDGHLVLGPGVENGQLGTPIRSISVDVAGRRTRVAEAARTGEGLAATDGVYIPRALVPDAVLAKSPSTVLVRLVPGADSAAIRAAIVERGIGETRTPDELAAERHRIKNGENMAVMAALVGVGALYALISLLSTLAISTTQRRSEFAIDRLTGLTRAQVVRVVRGETLVTVAIGLALGSAVAVTTLVGLWVGTWRSHRIPVIAVPWLLLLGMSLLVAGLATATADLATRHATHRRPVHDLTTKE